MKTEGKILLSRFLTRSGDQAWDFAVPLVLLTLFPSSQRIASIYFFAIKLGSVFFMPSAVGFAFITFEVASRRITNGRSL